MNREFFKIFKKGSVTYFYSSLFFPPEVRDDVFALYAFVRIADDFVDSVPAKKQEFLAFKKEYLKAVKSGRSENLIIDSMINLIEKRNFESDWVIDFLAVMEQDLYQTKCQTMDETINYMYGSAEVIGLMMAKIMNLPDKATESARLLGRAFQYVNFIRDIEEDNSLSRQYIPTEQLQKYGLKDLSQKEAFLKPQEFASLVHAQIAQYNKWMKQARIGFKVIPKRYRVPIMTSAQMYDWTAEQISKDPLVVYTAKIKPAPLQVIKQIAVNWWGK